MTTHHESNSVIQNRCFVVRTCRMSLTWNWNKINVYQDNNVNLKCFVFNIISMLVIWRAFLLLFSLCEPFLLIGFFFATFFLMGASLLLFFLSLGAIFAMWGSLWGDLFGACPPTKSFAGAHECIVLYVRRLTTRWALMTLSSFRWPDLNRMLIHRYLPFIISHYCFLHLYCSRVSLHKFIFNLVKEIKIAYIFITNMISNKCIYNCGPRMTICNIRVEPTRY